MSLRSGEKLGSFEILAVLGAGGFGEVYRAKDLKLGREVALKVLRGELSRDPERLRRFEREARAASALNHPNIVTVHDVGTCDSTPFMVMELVEGETLREVLSRGPLAPAELLRIAGQMADGLAKAHGAGIVHRDLKPENVMVSADGWVKILDFGLAKLANPTLVDSVQLTADREATASGAILGTISYMSPEQASGLEIDFRSDQFALGSILYEAATGRRPFQRDTPALTLVAILHSEPPRLDGLAPGLPHDLVALVHRLLAKEPGARYESSGDLARELHALHDPRAPSILTPPDDSATRERFEKTPSRAIAAGERRQVTIVASTLSGLAAMMERLEPEKVRQSAAGLEQAVRVITSRLGGLLHHSTGGEIVLLFGSAAAHEDDSYRAVQAAIEIHAVARKECADAERRLGQPVRYQTGVHTGALVIQGDTIAGTALQVATRLMAHADEDEILVSPEMERFIAPFFDTEAGRPFRLRGRSEAVTPRRVLRAARRATRLEMAERGSLSAFTGRDRELETLEHKAAIARNGEGGFVVVVGPPGIGKSRLIHELRQGLGGDFRLVQARAYPQGATVAYLPFIDALREELVPPGVGPGEAAEAVASRVREMDAELEESIPLYLHLLSLGSPERELPERVREGSFPLAMLQAIVALFTAMTKRGPVVMLIEDAHWADEASREVLKQLAPTASLLPLLVIMTCRPEYALDGFAPGALTLLPVGPLDASSSTSLIKAVLGAEHVPIELPRFIHERTGGNPFFIEEVCRTLLEDGTLEVVQGAVTVAGPLSELRLPETVETVIRIRLDRLDRGSLEVLRVASVVGREFSAALLEATLGSVPSPQILETLTSLGFIHRVRVFPEVVHRFQHILVQEVAYASLLEHQRKTLHGEVGQAIEGLYRGRLDAHLDALAHHFSAGEGWEKAVLYGRKAAARASALAQYTEALTKVERARQWLLKLPGDRIERATLADLLLEEERLADNLGLRDRQESAIRDLVELAQTPLDRGRQAEICIRKGGLDTLMARYAEAEMALNHAIALHREASDRPGERTGLRSLGFLHWHRHDYQAAIACAQAALEIDRELADLAATGHDMGVLGRAFQSAGNLDRAAECFLEQLELAQRTGDVFPEHHSLHNLGMVYRIKGQLDDAIRCFERSLDMYQSHERDIEKRLGHWGRLRLQQHRVVAQNSLAVILWDQGKREESIRLYQDSADKSRSIGYVHGLVETLPSLGRLLIVLDRWQEALASFGEAAALFRQLGDRESEASMQLDQLEALEALARLERDESPESALAHYREARDVARRLGDRARESVLLNSMGITNWRRGHYAAALAHYEEALLNCEELGDTGHRGLLLNSLGVTLKDMGRLDEARMRLEEAVDVNRKSLRQTLEGHSLAALGDVLSRQGDSGRALEKYEISLQIRRSAGDRKGEGWMLWSIARERLGRGEVDSARDACSRAADMARACDDPELERVTGELLSSMVGRGGEDATVRD
jgi:serine/threonine protein kinase/tetratricopeptide (TPR) repeat protein